MAKEIERKFLVNGDAWRALAKGTMYRQGYLNSAKERTVRIRTADEKAFLTIKGITVGAIRSEYEYEIPFDEGNAMLEELAEKPLIEKRRYKIPVAGVAHGFITPIRALALHFSRCWFAHSLKASTIASFDTNDFGHAEGIDIVIKSWRSLMSFNVRPFVKT